MAVIVPTLQGGDPDAFKKQLHSLLGPQRCQYIQLVDAVLCLEEAGGALAKQHHTVPRNAHNHERMTHL
jgi:hypothetical protein